MPLLASATPVTSLKILLECRLVVSLSKANRGFGTIRLSISISETNLRNRLKQLGTVPTCWIYCLALSFKSLEQTGPETNEKVLGTTAASMENTC